jgi:hypothetical protein
MRRLACLGLTLLVAACSDGGSGVNADAPVAVALQIVPLTPERAGTTVRYEFRVGVQDRNGDIFGGQCEIATNVSTVTRNIGILAPGTDPAATQMTVTCTRDYTPTIPQDIIGTAVIIDVAGHRSNALSFRLGIRQVPNGSAAPLSQATQPFDDRMER